MTKDIEALFDELGYTGAAIKFLLNDERRIAAVALYRSGVAELERREEDVATRELALVDLDRREVAVTEREHKVDGREEAVVAREDGLGVRTSAVDQREAEVARRELAVGPYVKMIDDLRFTFNVEETPADAAK